MRIDYFDLRCPIHTDQEDREIEDDDGDEPLDVEAVLPIAHTIIRHISTANEISWKKNISAEVYGFILL